MKAVNYLKDPKIPFIATNEDLTFPGQVPGRVSWLDKREERYRNFVPTPEMLDTGTGKIYLSIIRVEFSYNYNAFKRIVKVLLFRVLDSRPRFLALSQV